VIDLHEVLRAPPGPGGPPAAQVPSMSVIVPVYNGATTVGEALESVFAQQPTPSEVIVSDDGSEDDLAGALRPFGDRVRVVRGPNAGLATARNRAAAIATGELLALLDADDVWLPGRAAVLAEAARIRPDLDVVTTDAFVVRERGRDVDTYYHTRSFPVDDQPGEIVRASFIFGAAAIRRSAFARVGGYDARARYAEDWDLWLRLLTTGSRAGLVDVPLYEYRRRSDSLTGRRVDLALGVIDALVRARSLPLTASQRQALGATESEWRLRAARAAIAAADPRRFRLALRLAATPGAAPADRIKVLARLALPPRGVV
jgi:glycosyltransferase involved in cell wall biosynthesis